MQVNLFEIQNIVSIPSLTKYLLWSNTLICGPYHKISYQLHRDNQDIIPLLQAIDQYLLMTEDTQIKTQSHYIYHFHYHIPLGWFKITFQHKQHIYVLYEKNTLTTYSKIPDITEYLNNQT